MDLREYLSKFGLFKESVENFLKKNPIRNVEQISIRVDYLKNVFNYSDEEIKFLMEENPFIFKLVTESEHIKSINGILTFYIRNLGFSAKEMGEIILKFPTILFLDLEINEPYTVQGHIDHFKNVLNLTNNKIRELIKENPEILIRDINSLKLDNYIDEDNQVQI